MSALGMNEKGEVRSASEFKQIFDETKVSNAPYKCPFCEVRYVERCIVTNCVKAPHFALPKGTDHINGCNGEAGDDVKLIEAAAPTQTKRVIVGEIELPMALVKRRKATLVRRPTDSGQISPPDALEVTRRRKVVSADKTVATYYTASSLRPIVHAYKKLRTYTADNALEEGLERGTTAYNNYFRDALNSHNLALYGDKLTYGNAFQSSKLVPGTKARIYHGRGKVNVNVDRNRLTIHDGDKWPIKLKTLDGALSLEVHISTIVEPDVSTYHRHLLADLEKLVASGRSVEWYAYGASMPHEDKFEIVLASLDHIYWIEPGQS